MELLRFFVISVLTFSITFAQNPFEAIDTELQALIIEGFDLDGLEGVDWITVSEDGKTIEIYGMTATPQEWKESLSTSPQTFGEEELRTILREIFGDQIVFDTDEPDLPVEEIEVADDTLIEPEVNEELTQALTEVFGDNESDPTGRIESAEELRQILIEMFEDVEFSNYNESGEDFNQVEETGGDGMIINPIELEDIPPTNVEDVSDNQATGGKEIYPNDVAEILALLEREQAILSDPPRNPDINGVKSEPINRMTLPTSLPDTGAGL